MPKLTLGRFFVLLFILTSLLPTVVLGAIHVNFLHKVLNYNKSFLNLIEHEEFILFTIYFGVIIIGIILGAFFFKNFVSKPIAEIVEKISKFSHNHYPPTLKTDKIFFYEIKQFIKKFNEMLSSLKEAKEHEQDFISSLSHDIKIPLIAEKKAFDLIKNYNLPDEDTRKITESLINNNVNLINLVNSLLDVFKFESHEISIIKEKITAKLSLNQSLVSLYPILKEKNIKIIEEVEPSISLNVDIIQFKRVINNILLNAVENSSNGAQIIVRISEKPKQREIIIEDNGVGIEADLLNTLFEKYSSFSKSKTGIGLGLYISKLIVERHGGSISVSSKLNEGTKFTILIPSK